MTPLASALLAGVLAAVVVLSVAAIFGRGPFRNLPQRRRGYGYRPPRYWYCTAGHKHRTPAAADRCSAAQHR